MRTLKPWDYICFTVFFCLLCRGRREGCGGVLGEISCGEMCLSKAQYHNIKSFKHDDVKIMK